MKSMKYRFFILGLAAILFTACAVNEEDHSAPAIDTEELFYATIEDASTRVFVDDLLRVRWNADDRVSIFNRTTYNRQYRFNGQDGDNSGSFSKVPTDEFVTSNPLDYVYSVYPYNENTRITDDGEITVYLPAETTYREDSFGLGDNTMIAVADDNELMFKNLCGYIMLRLYGDNVAVTSISLKGNRNEPLAGKATVTAVLDGVPSLSFDGTATDEITMTFDSPVVLGATEETATTFWLVVPPTTFDAGITLTVRTSDGLQFQKSTTQSLELARNTRSRMASLHVVPVFSANHYLTFASEGTTTLSLANFGGNVPVLYYSTDTVDWTPWDYSELTFTAGHPLYLCGDNPEGINKSWVSEGEGEYSNFIAGGSNFSVSGSIMSLLDRLDNLTAIPCEQCFCDLFNGCSLLTAGPELPATTLTTACYNHLFSGCTSLAAAPALPATTLAERCYQGLFRNCISLAEAPELPATTLAYRCYRLMFNNCLSLAMAPVLPATTLEGGCYYQMFYGCSNLTAAPELPVTTLAPDCYREMFNNCTGLTTAPELPATTLADNCYYYMFSRCSGLETAPALPATTLAHSCYLCMFYGCTGLTTAPELPATTLAPSCYEAMFYNCTGLTSAPELPATTLAEACYRGMFSGCSQLNHVKCHATDISAPGCTVAWLRDVSETGTFVKAAEMNDWPRNSSGIPEGWTVQNDDGSPYIEWKCLTFKSEGTTTLSLSNFNGNAPVLYYSYDKTHWSIWDYSELTFISNYPLYICGDNPQGFSTNTGSLRRSSFTAYGSDFQVSGNIMSLIDKENDVTVIPSSDCFRQLFNGCTGLTSAPDLPATTLARFCYCLMFQGCTGLTNAPELPATTLADRCYTSMFSGCTGLTNAPELPATSLMDYCYSSMFNGCTGLTNAPDLPATSLAENCYSSMFYGCTSLTNAPELPATSLANRCYSSMFSGCTGLTNAPELPATSLASYCYSSMFSGCTSLATAPELPATSLADRCYQSMFSGCTSLATAPELPATSLASYCYSSMFSGCTQLNYVKCMATDISAENCTSQWLDGVAPTGTFVKSIWMNDWPQGISGIPEGWTAQVDAITANKYLTFTSEGTTTLSLTNYEDNAPVLCYSFDKNNWTLWDYSGLSFTSDQPLYICGYNPKGFNTKLGDTIRYSTFTADGSNFQVSGDIMSLIDMNKEVRIIPSAYCLYRLFYECGGLTTAPALPATKLTDQCYMSMFNGCTNLATAPALPATRLAPYCYSNIFDGCTSLATAPELPVMALAEYCYKSMFRNCTSLTTAPELPATTLEGSCYEYMFNGCTSLTNAPVLPATSLAPYCYSNMFDGCTSLTTTPELPVMALAGYCYKSMFRNCTSLTTAPELPATVMNDYCYYAMFSGCTGLTTAPELPATALATRCYYSMFRNCTGLMTAPELPATTLESGCYYQMFQGCTSLTTAPELPATALAARCYYNMFQGCTQLNYVKCLATDISADYCTTQWLDGVAPSGTFVKVAGMNDWPQGISGIPEGWTVQDNVFP